MNDTKTQNSSPAQQQEFMDDTKSKSFSLKQEQEENTKLVFPSPEQEQELLKSVATSLSSVNVAIATFSLAALTQIKSPKDTILNDLLVGFGLSTLITAALLIDALFDSYGWKIGKRFQVLNHGYALFCLVVSAMTVAIIWFYAYQELPATFSLPRTRIILSVLTIFSGSSIFSKLMSKANEPLKDFITMSWLLASHVACILVIKLWL